MQPQLQLSGATAILSNAEDKIEISPFNAADMIQKQASLEEEEARELESGDDFVHIQVYDFQWKMRKIFLENLEGHLF